MVVTQNVLKELFDYRDGELYWEVSRGNVKIGDRAGTDNKKGYRQVKIDGKQYFAHRIIFLYHHGDLPEFLDHIDGDPLNNEISNLRGATLSQNQKNRKKNKSRNEKSTSSQFKGVYRDKRREKWAAQIRIDGRHKHLGYFTSEIEAAKAYDKTAIEAFGEFAKPNGV